MSLNFETGEIPKDEPVVSEKDYEQSFAKDTDSNSGPDTNQDPNALACIECGTPLTYAGRGAKPKYCADHKAGRSKTARQSSSPALGGNASGQAAVAASLLARVNTLVGMSLNVFGMPLSSAQLLAANEDFEKLAREALAADPKLARKIIGAGGTSGKAGLTMAYAILGASIAPVAYGEIKSKRESVEDA